MNLRVKTETPTKNKTNKIEIFFCEKEMTYFCIRKNATN